MENVKYKDNRLTRSGAIGSNLMHSKSGKMNYRSGDRIQLWEEDLKMSKEREPTKFCFFKGWLSSLEVLNFQTQIAKIKRIVNRLRNQMLDRQERIEDQGDQ